MSIYLTGRVLRARMETLEQKLALMALVDAADDDGNLLEVDIAFVARVACTDSTGARRLVNQLQKAEWVHRGDYSPSGPSLKIDVAKVEAAAT